MKRYYFLLFIVLFSGFSFTQTDDQKKQEFSKKVRDGDMLFSQGKFLEAKKTYEAAATLNPNDENVRKQIQICDANEQKKSGFEADKEYNKLINKADEKFKAGDYQGAKDLFTRATKIKTSDTYPPKMLRQIEDLLNPKPIVKADPLPDLGKTSEMSLEEAQKALKEADIARKNEQNSGVIKKSEVLTKNEEEARLNRIKEMEASGVSLSEVKKRIDSLQKEDIHAKDSLNLKLQHEENSVSSVSRFQQSYQRDLLGFVDRTLVNKNKINDSVTAKNIQIGSQNDTVLFNRATKEDVATMKLDSTMNSSRTNSNQKISTIVNKEEKRVNDNIVSKEEVVELVKETNEEIQDLELKLIDKNRKNNNENVENNLIFSEKEDARELEVRKIIGVNNETLTKKSTNHIQIDDSLSIFPINRRNELNDSLNKLHLKNEIDDLNHRDSNRIEVNNQVKASIKVVLNEINDIEQNQLNKRQSSKVEITQKIDQNIGLEDSITKIENHSSAKIEEISKKQDVVTAENAKNEADEMNSSALKLTSLETETIKYNSQGATKPNDSQSSIDNIHNRLESSKDLEVEKNNVKALNAKSYIENIEKKEVQFDDKAANSIGTLYPEGVTQEQFNKTDDKGSLLAVVTRRIVVKNGYGQIYTRNQTKDYITYSKNGAPSTEAVWQRETQDAKLKKN